MAELGRDRERSAGLPLTPDGVSAALDELRRSVVREEDSGLAAILGAAESVATRWLGQRARVEEHRRGLDEALRDERNAEAQLDLVLRALAELSAAEAGPEATPAADPPREGWRARLRRPGRAPRPPESYPAGPPTAAVTLIAAGGHGDERPLSGHEAATAGAEPALTPGEASAEPRSVPGRVRADDAGPRQAEPGAAADVAVHLLGDFRLQVGGRPLEEWQGAKSQRVIRYLMAHPRHPVPKDVLVDIFWPETSAEAGRHNLHQAVYVIRKTVRDHAAEMQMIIHDNDAYAINTELEVWCDTEEFEAEIAVARAAERVGEPERALEAYAAAERRYGGDFLQDSPYEEWALAERDRLRLLYTEAANHLGDLLLDRGAVEPALQLSQRLISRDPCDEDAHRRAMRCFAATGRRTLVVRQYRTCVDTLARVLALGPSRETTHLYASLIAD